MSSPFILQQDQPVLEEPSPAEPRGHRSNGMDGRTLVRLLRQSGLRVEGQETFQELSEAYGHLVRAGRVAS
jgi:hypothetical protein